MVSLNISVPESAKQHIDQQVSAGAYADAADYITALIEADKHRKLRDEVEAMLLEGVDSPSTPLTDADFEEVERLGTAYLARKAKR